MAQGWSRTGVDTRKELQSPESCPPHSLPHPGLCLPLPASPLPYPHPRPAPPRPQHTVRCHPQAPNISILSTDLVQEAEGRSPEEASPLLGWGVLVGAAWLEGLNVCQPKPAGRPSALFLFNTHNPIFAQEDVFSSRAGHWPPPWPFPSQPRGPSSPDVFLHACRSLGSNRLMEPCCLSHGGRRWPAGFM